MNTTPVPRLTRAQYETGRKHARMMRAPRRSTDIPAAALARTNDALDGLRIAQIDVMLAARDVIYIAGAGHDPLRTAGYFFDADPEWRAAVKELFGPPTPRRFGLDPKRLPR